MRKFILSFFFCFLLFSLHAQEKKLALVKGRIVSMQKKSLPDIQIILPNLKQLTFTDETGEFSFHHVPFGNYTLIAGEQPNSDSFLISVDKAVVDLGDLECERTAYLFPSRASEFAVIALDESTVSSEDEGMSPQHISGILSASRDPYLSVAAFTFGPLGYQIRGYQREGLEVRMNGLLMNDVESGSAFFGQWSGLNDVFRNQMTVFGLSPAEDGFGGLIGITSIDATAATQRQQTRISYSNSNRTYRHRFMVTHSTGLLNNGWALSFSASKRWAKEGYIPGTSYDSYAYFLAFSKKLTAKSMLHLTTFGAPTKKGKAMAATQEAMDLAGSHFYNPNWGYLNGEKRNARINNSFQPLVMLNYEYKPNPLTKLNLAASFQTGFHGNSALDWYNAQDPRPDYYKNLPSYYLNQAQGADENTAESVRQEWLANPNNAQVNWQRLYEVNQLNIETIEGTSGKRSLYVLGEDRDDSRKFNFAGQFLKNINEHVTVIFGAQFIQQKTNSYRKMLDLLGGDFYVNLNQFAERTYIGNSEYNQNDLNHPNQIILQGDRYQYNYIANFTKGSLWGQGVFRYHKLDFFIAARAGMDAFSREGLYKNGLFQEDSYGKSDVQKFSTYDVKGGLTYQLDGRHYFFLNGAYFTKAPDFDHTFFSPRTRNASVAQSYLQKISSLEGGYLLNSPKLRGRLSGFLTQSEDETKILRYYNESYRTFINYVMQGVDIRNLGAELALQVKLSPTFSANVVATWMQVFYTSRPNIDIYMDNDTTSVLSKNTVYWKNYFVGSGPQSAYTLGLNYSSPKFWYASINVNYLDRSYLDVNPSRLTEEAVGLITPNSPEWHKIVDQEKLPSTFTVDLFAGKSFTLNKVFKVIPSGTILFINLGVNNVLNNTNIITGGFQQLRFDYASRNPDRFPSKYFYGYGTNYFVNVSLKF